MRTEMRDANRTRVLDEAGRLFEDRGFAATTIRDIAAASDVSVGTVMAAGDKSALLVQMFDRAIAREHVRPRDDVQAWPDANAVDRMMGLVNPFVTMFTERQELARTYASILVSGTHASALFTKLAARLIEEMRDVLTRSTGVGAERAVELAELAYAAYVGTLFAWAGRVEARPEDLKRDLRARFSAVCGTEVSA